MESTKILTLVTSILRRGSSCPCYYYKIYNFNVTTCTGMAGTQNGHLSLHAPSLVVKEEGAVFVIVNNRHLRGVENTAMLSVREQSTFNWYKMLILGKFCLKKSLKCLRRTVNFYKIR